MGMIINIRLREVNIVKTYKDNNKLVLKERLPLSVKKILSVYI